MASMQTDSSRLTFARLYIQMVHLVGECITESVAGRMILVLGRSSTKMQQRVLLTVRARSSDEPNTRAATAMVLRRWHMRDKNKINKTHLTEAVAVDCVYCLSKCETWHYKLAEKINIIREKVRRPYV